MGIAPVPWGLVLNPRGRSLRSTIYTTLQLNGATPVVEDGGLMGGRGRAGVGGRTEPPRPNKETKTILANS